MPAFTCVLPTSKFCVTNMLWHGASNIKSKTALGTSWARMDATGSTPPAPLISMELAPFLIYFRWPTVTGNL